MNSTAVPQGKVGTRHGIVAIALLTAATLLFGVFAESAPAAQIVGKDGKIYACYKAKGKRKGSVRLVAKNGRCKRGERKTSWSAAGPAGPRGEAGQAGASGPTGAAGQESKLLELSTRLEALEGVLKGVTNDTLTKALDTVKGITNAELLGALGSLGDVDALCEQATKLTDQVGALGTVIDGIGLNGVLTTLGGLINIPALPVALPAFSCDDAT